MFLITLSNLSDSETAVSEAVHVTMAAVSNLVSKLDSILYNSHNCNIHHKTQVHFWRS